MRSFRSISIFFLTVLLVFSFSPTSVSQPAYTDVNEQRLQSQKQLPALDDQPNLYVLSIGIRYDDIKYTAKDAEDFAGTFWKMNDNKGKGFDKIDVKLLKGKNQTTNINIRKALLDIGRSNIKEGDLVVVFISSLAKVLPSNKYMLIPSDFDPSYADVTGVDFMEDILKPLQRLKGRKLLLIDACYSIAGIPGTRKMPAEKTSRVMVNLINNMSGMEIMASCSKGEFSYEDDAWQNGAFTEAILEAFSNKKVDVNGKMIQADSSDPANNGQAGSDGLITIAELQQFISLRVPDLVEKAKGGAKQTPFFKGTQKDTPLYYLKEN